MWSHTMYLCISKAPFGSTRKPIIAIYHRNGYSQREEILQRQQQQYPMHHRGGKSGTLQYLVGIRNTALTHVQTIFDCYVCLRSEKINAMKQRQQQRQRNQRNKRSKKRKEKKTKIIIYISHTIENWIRQHSFSSDTPQTANALDTHTHKRTGSFLHLVRSLSCVYGSASSSTVAVVTILSGWITRVSTHSERVFESLVVCVSACVCLRVLFFFTKTVPAAVARWCVRVCVHFFILFVWHLLYAQK